jgi:hypothetical protein
LRKKNTREAVLRKQRKNGKSKEIPGKAKRLGAR